MSMADRDGFIWYDGKLVPWREANTHVLTHSLHYGLAVFEGVRAYKTESLGTAIFRVKHDEETGQQSFLREVTRTHLKQQHERADTFYYRSNRLAPIATFMGDLDAHAGQEDAWEAWNKTMPPIPEDATVSLGYSAKDMPQR